MRLSRAANSQWKTMKVKVPQPSNNQNMTKAGMGVILRQNADCLVIYSSLWQEADVETKAWRCMYNVGTCSLFFLPCLNSSLLLSDFMNTDSGSSLLFCTAVKPGCSLKGLLGEIKQAEGNKTVWYHLWPSKVTSNERILNCFMFPFLPKNFLSFCKVT